MSWLKKLLFRTNPIVEEMSQENDENIVCLDKGNYSELTFPLDRYVSLNFGEDARNGTIGFFEVAFDLMKTFSYSYQVVSYVDSCEYNCRRKKADVNACKFCRNFTAEYYRFLQEHNLTDRVFLNRPMEMITITEGLNQPLVKLLAFEGFRDNKNAFYCYQEIPFSCKTFDEIKEGLELAEYDIRLVYTEEHDNLAIHINTKTVDVDQIISQIESICISHKKELRRYL